MALLKTLKHMTIVTIDLWMVQSCLLLERFGKPVMESNIVKKIYQKLYCMGSSTVE